MSRFLIRTLLLSAAFGLLVGATPREASADASQLCRSISSIALAPFDVAFAPFITAKDMHYGLTEIDDPLAIRAAALVPGYFFLNGMQVGGALLRVIAGTFEFLPGLVTLFQEGSQPALFRNQDETWALYKNDFGPCPVRLGSSYNTINEF